MLIFVIGQHFSHGYVYLAATVVRYLCNNMLCIMILITRGWLEMSVLVELGNYTEKGKNSLRRSR